MKGKLLKIGVLASWTALFFSVSENMFSQAKADFILSPVNNIIKLSCVPDIQDWWEYQIKINVKNKQVVQRSFKHGNDQGAMFKYTNGKTKDLNVILFSKTIASWTLVDFVSINENEIKFGNRSENAKGLMFNGESSTIINLDTGRFHTRANALSMEGLCKVVVERKFYSNPVAPAL